MWLALLQEVSLMILFAKSFHPFFPQALYHNTDILTHKHTNMFTYTQLAFLHVYILQQRVVRGDSYLLSRMAMERLISSIW